MDSILQDDKFCIKCGTLFHLHKHHIYGGARRKLSEKYGCWCWLCAKHHNMSDQGVHFDKRYDDFLKQLCQCRFEEIHGDRDKFREVFRKSYL